MTLHPDVLLGVHISAAISRHRYDADPAAMLAELEQLAGARGDILAQEAGTWVGYHEHDHGCAVIVDALRGIPGAHQWVPVGRARRGMAHGTGDYAR